MPLTQAEADSLKADIGLRINALVEAPEPEPPPPPDPIVIVGDTLPTGLFEFEELHVHEGTILTILPGTELVRRDVPPADPAHADGGIVNHGTLRAVRLPGQPPIIIRSANPLGHRGHLMSHGPMVLDGVEFRDFGRTKNAPLDPLTNPIGRYACHLHLAGDFGRQSRIENCLVHDTVPASPYRYGITIHGTNGVICRNNIVRNKAGSGIYLEQFGIDNIIEGNTVEDINGTAQYPNHRGEFTDLGFDGSGIWLRSGMNYVRNNVAKRCSLAGFLFFPGPDKGILEFSGNHAEQCRSGIEYWRIGGTGPGDRAAIESFSAVDCEHGIYGYMAGSLLISDPTISRCRIGIWAGDYPQSHYLLRGGEITDCLSRGFEPSPRATGPVVVEGTRFRNKVDVMIRTPFSSGGGNVVLSRQTYLRSCLLEGETQIQMFFQPSLADGNYLSLDELHVEDYQQSGENFRVYYREQAPSFVLPAAVSARAVSSPEPGLTNQELWDKYGQALAGGVAPCSAERAGIQGFVCG